MSKKSSNIVAIITMCCIFAMISFVTNMAAPFGNIWGYKYSWAGMMGNMMTFAAYLFMGIPSGKMLLKVGYKKTLLIALAVGFTGLFIQYFSSFEFLGGKAVFVYLLGAFVCGLSLCMLNTVVNPMLHILGGGGNKANQLIQIGGTLNSFTGTCAPFLVGVLIGTVSSSTSMTNVAPLLFLAMGVFAAAFLIISRVSIPEPARERPDVKYEHSPWHFRHCVLGVIAIFFYVGTEVGIPSLLNFYLSDPAGNGAFEAGFAGAAAIGGSIAAMYWLFMMAGRFFGMFISGKVGSRAQLTVVSTVAILLIVTGISLPKDIMVRMPGFIAGKGFCMNDVPATALLFALCGLCTSVMWGGIFTLSVEGLGKYTEQASGIFMMMVVGGGVMPLIQESIAKNFGYVTSFWLPVAMLSYILFYALAGCRNVNRDIPVD